MRFAWEHAIAERGPDGTGSVSARNVGRAMAVYADAKTGEMFPGIDRLVRDTGLSRRSVVSALEVLRQAQWIERVRASNSRAGLSDVYRLTIPVANDAHGVQELHTVNTHGVQPQRPRGARDHAHGVQELHTNRPSQHTNRTDHSPGSPAAVDLRASVTTDQTTDSLVRWARPPWEVRADAYAMAIAMADELLREED